VPLSIKQMLHAPPIDALPLLKRFFLVFMHFPPIANKPWSGW
jgi:hypothetical protein